jgi:hypothetical protein
MNDCELIFKLTEYCNMDYYKLIFQPQHHYNMDDEFIFLLTEHLKNFGSNIKLTFYNIPPSLALYRLQTRKFWLKDILGLARLGRERRESGRPGLWLPEDIGRQKFDR